MRYPLCSVATRLAAVCLAIVLAALVVGTHPVGAQREPRPVTPKSLPHPPASPRASALPATAVPKNFSGTCPAMITFHSILKASRYPATVEYQWERSDDAT